MKKKLLIGIIVFWSLFCITGCNTNKPSNLNSVANNTILIHSQYFDAEVVEKIGNSYIIRDKNTNVLYLLVSGASHESTVMTPIYNEDGTLKTYKGDK